MKNSSLLDVTNVTTTSRVESRNWSSKASNGMSSASHVTHVMDNWDHSLSFPRTRTPTSVFHAMRRTLPTSVRSATCPSQDPESLTRTKIGTRSALPVTTATSASQDRDSRSKMRSVSVLTVTLNSMPRGAASVLKPSWESVSIFWHCLIDD